MSNALKKPDWYPLPIYNKELSPTEVLDAISERVVLKRYLKEAGSQEEKKKIFLDIIVEKALPPASNQLQKPLHKAIKPLSVFEAISIAHQIVHSHWYQTLKDKNQFEEIIIALTNNLSLNRSQKRIIEKFIDIPWNKFQNSENPWEKPRYSYGTPVTINTRISRDNAINELRRLKTKVNGNKKLKTLSLKVFNEWKRKKIFAVHDLNVWLEIHGIKRKNAKLGHLIWGASHPVSRSKKDSTVDMKHFVKDAIKLSEKAIKESTLNPLWLYCENELIKTPRRK